MKPLFLFLTALLAMALFGSGNAFALKNLPDGTAQAPRDPSIIFAQSIANTIRFVPTIANEEMSLLKDSIQYRIKVVEKKNKHSILHQNLSDRRWAAYRRWRMASRGGGYLNRPSLTLEATAYDPGPISCGPRATGRTSTGMHAGYGLVAVDPRVIPLGTHLYVEGYGYALAADIGSAIKGDRIDLGFNSYSDAMRFGRRTVRVYIIP